MKTKRSGFTLTELMVVVFVLLVLVGLVLVFYPRREVRHASDAASNLQSFIAGAKTRALKENRPIGVRFLSSDNYRTFDGVQLIDGDSTFAPFDKAAYAGGPMTIYLDLPAGVLIREANQNNGPVVGNVARQVGVPLQGSVEVGDMLEIVEVTPSTHRITAINYATNMMTLAASKEGFDDDNDGIIDRWEVSGIPNVNSTGSAKLGWNYRYLRKAKPLMGEQPYRFPKDVVLLGAGGVVPSSLNIPVGPTGEYELIFGPSGQVINSDNRRIVLWLADVNNVAKPELLCVYSATGTCISHPVGPVGNEYMYTQDGR